MPAVRRRGPRETIGEDAVSQTTPEFPFHVGRNALRVTVVLTSECAVGLQVLLDDWVERGLLRMASALGSRATSQ